MKKIYTTIISIIILTPCIHFSQTISGGTFHSITLCNTGTGRDWGWNISGQLGNGNNTDSNVPVAVNTLTNLIAVSGGDRHSLALRNDGTVWSWGKNLDGQLGNGNNTDSNIPVLVNTLTGIIAISGGKELHSLALKNDGTVWAWGYNTNGQLGNGNNTSTNVPIQVIGLTNIIAIAGGGGHSMALKNDGTVWTWGFNSQGQLGNGNNSNTNLPVQVSTLTGIIAISGGEAHSLALKNDGTVWAWGFNLYGQLGNGNNTDSNIPAQVTGLTGITAIAGGQYHSLCLKNDGTVRDWGRNNSGQLGNGNNTNSNLPLLIGSLTNITAISGGGLHSLALKNDGTLRTWGDNTFGALGNGNNTNSNVPVLVSGLCSVLCLTPPQPNNISGLTSLCVGVGVTSYSIASLIGATSYTWSLPGGWSGASVTNTISATPGTTGVFTVTASNACGTSPQQTLNVTVNPLPTISASTNNTLICTGQSVTITASGANNYTWNPGGTSTSISVSPTATSTYTINGTDVNGCMNSSVFTQSVSLCTDLNQLAKLPAEINIYPNPFDTKLIVVSNATTQHLQIFNTLGSLIYSSIIENEKTEIDLSTQPNGIYFIRIGAVTKKIIKE